MHPATGSHRDVQAANLLMSVIAVCRPVSTFPPFSVYLGPLFVSGFSPVCPVACLPHGIVYVLTATNVLFLRLTVSSRLASCDSGQHALIETYRGESYGTRVGLSFTPFGRARLCCAGADRISAVSALLSFLLWGWALPSRGGQPFGTLGACFFSAFRFSMSGVQRQVLPALCCPGLHASGNPAPLSQVCWALGRKRLVLERCCLSFAAQASCSLRTTLCESESNTIV